MVWARLHAGAMVAMRASEILGGAAVVGAMSTMVMIRATAVAILGATVAAVSVGLNHGD